MNNTIKLYCITYYITQHIGFLNFEFSQFHNMKYIVITGGVVSGLGKGITISSIGRVLKASGMKVTSIKIDPYLNGVQMFCI